MSQREIFRRMVRTVDRKLVRSQLEHMGYPSDNTAAEHVADIMQKRDYNFANAIDLYERDVLARAKEVAKARAERKKKEV